jgi:pentatricopeptide repeat protein
MVSSHICLACRRRLGQIGTPRGVQSPLRASFVSLSGSSKITDQRGRDSLLHLGDNGDRRKGVYHEAVWERTNRARRPTNTKEPGDHLESLFAESIKLPASLSTTTSKPSIHVNPYQNAETLRQMLADETCPVIDSWQFFLLHFGPDAWKQGSMDRKSMPSYLYLRDGAYSGRALLQRIVRAKDVDSHSTTLPSFTELTRVYSQLGILHGQDWASLMHSLIGKILAHKDSPLHDELINSLLEDLTGSWNVVFCQSGNSTDHQTIRFPVDWSHSPSISVREAFQAHNKGGMRSCFGLLVPGLKPNQLSDVPVIAAGTLALLTQNPFSQSPVAQQASPLISSLSYVISVLPAEIRPTADTSRADTVPIDEFLKVTWNETVKYAAQKAASSTEKGCSVKASSPPTRTGITFVHQTLQDAFNRRDGRQVDQLWSDVAKYPVKTEAADPGPGTQAPFHGFLSVGLCNIFILTYMALRQPNRAIDVWNHMVSNGLSPNLATWDSLMKGCKTSKDWRALENIWRKMQTLRVQPDNVCWTTRISALIECYQVDKAIHALDEMGQLWLNAARRKHGNLKLEELKTKSDVHEAVKPSISTVNAAVTGLLNRQSPEAAHRVLAWAGKFGIQPDIITYNTLLRSLIRKGQTKEAMALLQQLQNEGLLADAATFTTILDETFRYADDHTPEEQKDIIDNIFSEMEAVGVKPNLHTYGKIIYHLLERRNADMTAVNIVMEHMAAQDLQPTTYIYTILADHYFSREPPDLDAVRILTERSRMNPGSVDNIFWDRLIEGYSKVGDTTSAVRILGKVNSGSSRISWVTLRKLLSALILNDEWDVARTLVRNAKIDSGGPLPDYIHGKKHQHHFWDLVAELGLLDA